MKDIRLEDMDSKALVGTGEVAECLGCCRQTVRNWVAKGYLNSDFITPSRRLKFRVSDILAFKKKAQ